MDRLWQYAQLGGVLVSFACLGHVAFRHFPWPIRLAFGQFALLVYAYFRTATTALGMPGLQSWELWIPLGAAFVWTVYTRPKVRHPWVLAAAFAVLCALLALRLPDLGTLSSDPDLHAFQTKGFLAAGRFTGFYPGSEVADRYPGGFRVLNLVWGRLTGWNAVTLVNVQPYVQAVIFALAAVFLFARAVPSRQRGTYLKWAVVSALLVYLPAWGEGRQHNEGTARLAANGFLLLPLCAAWLGRRRRSLGVFSLSGVTLPMAVSFHPALIGPLVALTAVAFAFLRPRRNAWLSFAVGAIFFGGIVLWTDPFLRSWGAIGVNQEGNPTQPLPAVAVWDWIGLPLAVIVGALSHCALAGHGWSGLSGAAVALGRRSLRRTPGLDMALPIWALFLFIAAAGVEILERTIPRASLGPYLFYRYTQATTDQIALALAGAILPVLWLMFRRNRAGGLILAILAVGFLLRVEEDWRVGLRSMRRSPLGQVTPSAVALVRAAEGMVAPGERVLLSGRIMEGPWETWVMPENASRAVALYSNLPTAFFYGVDHPDFRAENYRRYVQTQLDRDWLKARGVRWAIVQGEDGRFSGLPVVLERGEVKLVRIE